MQANKLSVENDTKHWFERYTLLVESNIRGVQLGIYSVAFCGLAIALRSVRPFKKFTSPSQIPHSFFDSNIKLDGKVLNIDMTKKPLLLVDHRPIFFHKFRAEGPPLPLEIEGINVSQNGISWLQTIVKGEPIEFVLLKRNPESISGIVTLKNRNIAKHLVSIGFASVAPFDLELKSMQVFSNYYAELLKAEEKAEKKKVGMWTAAITQFSIVDTVSRVISLLRQPFHKRVVLLRARA